MNLFHTAWMVRLFWTSSTCSRRPWIIIKHTRTLSILINWFCWTSYTCTFLCELFILFAVTFSCLFVKNLVRWTYYTSTIKFLCTFLALASPFFLVIYFIHSTRTTWTSYSIKSWLTNTRYCPSFFSNICYIFTYIWNLTKSTLRYLVSTDVIRRNWKRTWALTLFIHNKSITTYTISNLILYSSLCTTQTITSSRTWTSLTTWMTF